MVDGPGSVVGGAAAGVGALAWPKVFRELSRRDKIALVGNGQHLASTGAFVMWVLSNLVHVDDLDYRFHFVGEHRLATETIVIDDDSE